MFNSIVKGLSFGMITPTDNGVMIKDPITAAGNTMANLKDEIFH